jgi:thiol:disulfide interchange protein
MHNRLPEPGHSGRDNDRPGSARGSGIVAGIGAAVVLVLCCAAPALLAAGALGAVGAWLSNPWVITAALALVILAVVITLTHRRTR